MTIQMKALIQTAKMFGFGLAVGIGYYFFLELVGLKIGVITMGSAFALWAFWIGYQANLSSLKILEDSDKSV